MSRRAVSCESEDDASGPGEGSAGGAPSSMGAGVDEDGSSGSSSCAPRFLPLRPLAETWRGVRARARAQNAVQARLRTRSEPRNGALVSRTGQASGSELTMRRSAAPRWLAAWRVQREVEAWRLASFASFGSESEAQMVFPWLKTIGKAWRGLRAEVLARRPPFDSACCGPWSA